MLTLLAILACFVLGLHVVRRDWSSPSVYAATAFLAAALGAHPGLAAAEEAVFSSEPAEIEAEAADSADSSELVTEDDAALAGRDPSEIVDSPEGLPLRDVSEVHYLDRDDDTPSWVTKEKTEWSDENGRWLVVRTDVELNQDDAREALRRTILAAVQDEVNLIAARAGGARHVQYSLDELHRRGVVDTEFYERLRVPSSEEAVWQANALLHLSDELHADIREQLKQATAVHRLIQTAAFAGFGLLLLGSLCGYFKLDTATRGYYTRRLQFATAATILAVVAAGFLAARFVVPWM